MHRRFFVFSPMTAAPYAVCRMPCYASSFPGVERCLLCSILMWTDFDPVIVRRQSRMERKGAGSSRNESARVHILLSIRQPDQSSN